MEEHYIQPTPHNLQIIHRPTGKVISTFDRDESDGAEKYKDELNSTPTPTSMQEADQPHWG